MTLDELIRFYEEKVGCCNTADADVYEETVEVLQWMRSAREKLEYLKERVREAATEMPFDNIEFTSHHNSAVFGAAIRDVNEWSDKTLREVEAIV